MDEKQFLHDTDDKYGDFSNFEFELEALKKFENINRSSSHNLRTSQSRMIVGFIFILCLTVALGVISFVMSRRTTHDIKDLYDGTLSVRFYALNLNINAHKAYLSMRELALSDEGDSERINYYAERTRKSVTMVNENFSALKALATESKTLTSKLDELESLLLRWDAMREEYIQYALDGNMARCRAGVTGALAFMVGEVNDCISEMASDATKIAADDYEAMLSRSSIFDIYTISLTLIIAAASIIIIIFVQKNASRAAKLVDEAQSEQNEILDELVIMDETLRQSLAKTEHESERVIELKEKYANSLEATNDAIWEVNIETNEYFASEKWGDVTGLPTIEIFDLEKLLPSIYEEDRKKFQDAFSKGSGQFSTQVRVNPVGSPPDSPPRWIGIRGKWLDDCRLTGSVSDITEKKLSEEHIEYMAYHDHTTRLPNREMFVHALRDALKKAEETGGSGCVLFIDIDNFKLINDGHGHNLGDSLLLEIARRLGQTVGENEVLARFGGDEFLILVESIADSEAAHKYVKLIMDTFKAPFSLNNELFYLTASIGVALFPDDGKDVTQILKNSDSAMYESKSAGRNTYALYNKAMSAKLIRKAAIGDILHRAIEDDIVYMVYQPQIRCSDNKVLGCEALMRLRDQELGFISPAEFIPVAEDTRLIIPLGYWAIRNVIEAELALREKGVILDSISVNVSELQLRERDFIDKVKKIIDEYDYDASKLHFEITESILLSDIEEEIRILNGLTDIGIKIELDDFGTGYSSLNYVRMIPLDVIKIDKCFTDEIGINSEKEGLIDLIIRLAGTFGANIVAEGVETIEQVDFFKEKGNVILQGYYYSKPLEINNFEVKFKELSGASQR